MEQALQRYGERLYDTKVFEDWPIHFAGAAAFLFNQSPTLASVITVDESNDGTTWTPVILANLNSEVNLNITVVPLSYAVFLFTSRAKYVRFTCTASNPAGIHFHLVSWMPRSTQESDQYA